MDNLDPFLLSRIQFAANISFHILFPAITIALGWILLFFKLRFNATGNAAWMDIYRFWVKVFALSFAMGVVSGVTMSFQFGTNWPGYMNTVGNIAGPLLAYEVITAFFLEASFLAIMLFGIDRVSNRIHTLATVLVAAGTTLSAFWILALNSWMQTPQGFEMIDGRAYATDWLKIVFNPSFPYRLTHMLLASGLTASFLIAGLSAFRWLRGERSESVRLAMKTGVYLATFLIPLQIAVGDLHGLNTLKHQPAKIAAMEAIWDTGANVPLLLFAVPDQQEKTNHFEIGIPDLANIILTHDRTTDIAGLNDFDDIPPVAPVFYSFRIMVGIGILMLVVSWYCFYRLTRFKAINRLGARMLAAMTFSGWVAVLAGWYVTEIGRQPFLVYNVLRTEDAVGPVTGPMVGTSLTLYLTLYAVLLAAFIGTLFYMARKGDAIRAGSTLGDDGHVHVKPDRGGAK